MIASPRLESWIIRSSPSFRLVDSEVSSLMELDIKSRLLTLTPTAIAEGYTDNCRVIPVWRGASDDTIYSHPTVNYHMRALHDHMHLVLRAEFATEDEITVSRALCSLAGASGLPREDIFLLSVDNQGQTLYHELTGGFPMNQRLFADACLQARSQIHWGAALVYECSLAIVREASAIYNNLGGL